MAENPDFTLVDDLANRRTSESTWTSIPDWVLHHPDLGQVDIVVYLVLSDHADNGTGECHPGQKLIMAESRIRDKRVLWHALSRLAAIGAIAIEQHRGMNNTYRLIDRCI